MSCSEKIVFRHGFGFTHRFWDHLAAWFPKADCVFRGDNYFHSQKTDDTRLPQKNIRIGIGHSLGFWQLCHELPHAQYLIGLNAFTCFLGNDPDFRAQRIKEHTTLQNHLNENPQLTLRNFYKRCGVPHPAPETLSINLEKMNHDLNLLKQSVILPQTPRVLIINALHDPIVPQCMTEDNFKHTPAVVHLLNGNHHGLGFLHAQEVAKIILDFIQ